MLSPKYCGILFFALVPMFALLYYIFPFGVSCDGDIDIITSLYLSTEVITTLGLGDVYAVKWYGKLLIIAESLLGVLSIGMFLNAVSRTQSVIDSEKARQVEERKKREAALSSLQRFDSIVQMHLRQVSIYMSRLVLPTIKRGSVTEVDRNYDWHVFTDIYNPSLLMRDNIGTPVIVYFYRSVFSLRDVVEDTLRNMDFVYFPELKEIYLQFLHDCWSYDSSEYLLAIVNNKKERDIMTDMLKNWSYPFEYHTSNAINYFVNLHNLIRKTLEFSDRYNEFVQRTHTEMTQGRC